MHKDVLIGLLHSHIREISMVQLQAGHIVSEDCLARKVRQAYEPTLWDWIAMCCIGKALRSISIFLQDNL